MAKDLAGAKEAEQAAAPEARVYGTLEAMVRAEGRELDRPGFRAYTVIENDGQRAFVVTNSPGNAALAVVEVQRVSGKALLSAALAAVSDAKHAAESES